MQDPRSSTHETAENRQVERSLSTEIFDDQERRELPLRGVMDTIPGLVWSHESTRRGERGRGLPDGVRAGDEG